MIIIPLMTSKNKPRLNTVIGKVKRTKIGFTKRFNTPKTSATVKAVVKASTTIPLKKVRNNHHQKSGN